MRSRHGKQRRKLYLVALLLTLIVFGFVGLAVWQHFDVLTGVSDGTGIERKTLEYQGRLYGLRNDLDTVLILGIDKFSDNLGRSDAFINNQQSDFLLLMVIDKSDQSFYGIHINRDSMAKIDRLGLGAKRIGSFTGQLALAHTYGSGGTDSCRNVLHAVSGMLFDLPIEHYYSVTLDAVPVLNDLVGGVTVYVEDDFSHTDPSIVQGTTMTLKGDQALTFVQARGSMQDKTNINRMARQRVYMDGLYKSMVECVNGEDTFALRLSTTLADYSVSDMLIQEMANLAQRVAGYRFDGIKTIKGEARLGEEFMEFYPDEEALLGLVVECFYKPL